VIPAPSLSEKVSAVPDPQRHNYDRAIACLSSRLTRYQQVPVELKAQLQPQIEALSGLQQKLTQPLLQIAVFGLVSRGKSAVLNALFGESIFPTGPLNGVTQWPRSVRWSPVLMPDHVSSVQLELIDTPGLDEISGESRAVMAKEIAACADLILFVTAGLPMSIELKALSELAQLAKPLLWVVNKADLYPDLTAEALYQSLTDSVLQSILSPREIVLTSAAPVPTQVRHEWSDGRVSLEWEAPPPHIEGLQHALIDLLHREGFLLLSLNVLLQVQHIERQMAAAIATFYLEPTQTAQWQLWSLKAVLIGLSPWAWPDLILNSVIDIVQVRQLIQRYGLSATNHQIESLWKTLGISVGLMGAAELGTTSLSWILDGLEGFPGLAVTATQGAIAAYSAALVGRSAQKYAVEGAPWDPQGSSTLIQYILEGLNETMIIHRLSGAIAMTLDSPAPGKQSKSLNA
jgi:uncharacterized protein